MDGHAATGGERMLRRILALLVAFAALAERAAARPAPVRWFVLCILRGAETVAEAFVLEAAGMLPAPEGIAAEGYGPDDALHLAARFYALAAALCALLPPKCRFGRPRGSRGTASVHVAPGSGRRLGRPRKPNDTS